MGGYVKINLFFYSLRFLLVHDERQNMLEYYEFEKIKFWYCTPESDRTNEPQFLL